MAIKYHTVILVPHARAKLRKWRVSNLQIAVALAVAFGLTVTAAFVLFSFFAGGVDNVQVDRLRSQNEGLREANLAFEQSIADLQGKLGDYESRTRQLAIVAGLDGAEGGEAGIGGAFLDASDGTDIGFLEYRADRLDGRLDRVEAKLEERMRWISSVPSITPVRGILTSGFGTRRDPITGRRTQHPAIDIAAPPGREVVASADGIVTRAGRIGGLGNAVYLSHGFGLNTRYGHMSRLAVRPGERVERGQLIGYVGSTGRSTGYHLHYEVHVDGEAMNPVGYLLDR
jgi:murein DD-endopeptidase MepM/ murein hydrolase activator NlpD